MGRRRTLGKKRRRRTNKRSSMMRRRRTINKMRGGINDSDPASRNFLNLILKKLNLPETELQTLITTLLNLGEGNTITINANNKQKVTRRGDDLIYNDKFGSDYAVDISDFKNLVEYNKLIP